MRVLTPTLSPTLATESATVRLFFLSALLCSVNKAACDFAHARPIMHCIHLVYIRVVRRALNLLRASFSPIFQYFSAVNVYTRLSFSLTCMPYMAPCAMDSLAMEGAVHSHSDFRVRRSVVHRALNWLVTHNQYCRSNHVHIDINPLQQLPHDGNLSTSLPSLLRTPSLNLLPPTLLQLVLLSPTPMQLLKIHIVPTFHSLLFPLPLDL